MTEPTFTVGQSIGPVDLQNIYGYVQSALQITRAEYVYSNTTGPADYGQTLAHDGTFTTLNGYTQVIDTIGLTHSGGNFTVPVGYGGQYEISAYVGAQSGDTLIALILVNAVSVRANRSADTGTVNNVVQIQANEFTLADGDVVTLGARVVSVAGIQLISGANGGDPAYTSYLRIKRLPS